MLTGSEGVVGEGFSVTRPLPSLLPSRAMLEVEMRRPREASLALLSSEIEEEECMRTERSERGRGGRGVGANAPLSMLCRWWDARAPLPLRAIVAGASSKPAIKRGAVELHRSKTDTLLDDEAPVEAVAPL